MSALTRSEAIAVGAKRYFNGKPCPRGHIDERMVSTWRCVACHRRDKRESKRAHYAADPERFRSAGKRDYQAHAARYKLNAVIKQRRAKRATLRCVAAAKLAAVYKERDRMTAITGILHHVDHIYPLAPSDGSFCGLHVPWNLQVITAEANLKKGSRYTGQ